MSEQDPLSRLAFAEEVMVSPAHELVQTALATCAGSTPAGIAP